MKKSVLALLLLCSPLPALFAETLPEAELNGMRITKIEIETRRVKPEIVRGVLPVKEGDTFDGQTLAKIRRRLNDMRFFKKIDLAAEKDADAQGVRLRILLEDGWFILPLPFVSGGGGGLNASLILVERNLFKRAESVTLFGGGNDEGGFGAISLRAGPLSFSANAAGRRFTERGYADGAFNTVGRFRTSDSEDDPGQYGTIRDQYEKKVREFGLQSRFPLAKRISGLLGFSSQKTDYANLQAGALPGDAGTASSAAAGLGFSTSRPEDADSLFSLQDLGAVFGFGMADLKERIKPLPKAQARFSADAHVSESRRDMGSDFNFTKAGLGLASGVTFRNRQRVSVRARAGAGVRDNLPLGQKPATNRDLGLRGNYAREYRGDRGAGASLSFVHPFRRTLRGAWSGELFADAAGVWDNGKTRGKQGAGFGLGYQFWRFPLPLGFTYSYSFDDRDSQVNFAFGGRF